MYTVTLNDGTRLENLKLNGNNFISDILIEDSVFEGNLDKVVIFDGENEEIYTDQRLMANRVIDGKSWFVLGEKSAEYKMQEKIKELEQASPEGVYDDFAAAIREGVNSYGQ